MGRRDEGPGLAPLAHLLEAQAAAGAVWAVASLVVVGGIRGCWVLCPGVAVVLAPSSCCNMVPPFFLLWICLHPCHVRYITRKKNQVL